MSYTNKSEPTMRELMGSFYDMVFDKAVGIIGSGEQHPHVIITVTHERKMKVAEIIGDNKNAVAGFLQSQVNAPDTLFVCQIAEAWAWSEDSEKIRREADPEKLKTKEKKQEVLMVSLIAANERAFVTCPIKRPDNTIEKLPLNFDDEFDKLTGRFMPEVNKRTN